MLEYPEIMTIVGQMRSSLIGKTIESGELVKKNGNMFMSEADAEAYSLLAGGAVVEIDCSPPEIYVKLDNGYGIMIRQSGGRILYNPTPGDVPKTHNIIFRFTDSSSLTYTMSLFTLGFFAVTHERWQNHVKNDKKLDPLGVSYCAFANRAAEEENGKTAVKLFLVGNLQGVMSTFAAEILLYAGVYPSTQVKKLSKDELERVYTAMRMVLTAACEQGGRATECDLYGKKGGYVAMAERKHIGGPCPVCGAALEKNSTGGVTAFCPRCQVKA